MKIALFLLPIILLGCSTVDDPKITIQKPKKNVPAEASSLTPQQQMIQNLQKQVVILQEQYNTAKQNVVINQLVDVQKCIKNMQHTIQNQSNTINALNAKVKELTEANEELARKKNSSSVRVGLDGKIHLY